MFVGHFSQKSPLISSSVAKNDLQLKASYESSPPCTQLGSELTFANLFLGRLDHQIRRLDFLEPKKKEEREEFSRVSLTILLQNQLGGELTFREFLSPSTRFLGRKDRNKFSKVRSLRNWK